LRRNLRRLQRLYEALGRRRKLLVLTHDNPDPDAIASAWMLGRIARRLRKIRVTLAYGGIIGRSENRALIEVLRIPLQPLDTLDLGSFDTFALVDTQPRTGNNSLPDGIDPTIVFDHHPCRKATRSVPYFDVRENYGATTTILYEYLLAADINLDRRLASAIFYAIRSETQNLGREAERVDARVFLDTFPFVDNEALSRIEHAPLPRSYFAMIDRAIDGTSLYAEIAVTLLGDVVYPDMVAQFADLIVRVEGIEWALCMGRFEGDLLLSLRTQKVRAKAGKMIRSIVGSQGAAGGHDMIAGGKIAGAALTQTRARRMEELMRKRLLRELGATGIRSTKLTRSL
jgi:nanoRNase/pAp phosphatase (c-di-AMP/oligoRNAs hydrolase)